MNIGVVFLPTSGKGSSGLEHLAGSEADTWRILSRHAGMRGIELKWLSTRMLYQQLNRFDLIWDRVRFQSNTEFTTFSRFRKTYFCQHDSKDLPLWMNGPFLNKWKVHEQFAERAASAGVRFPETIHVASEPATIHAFWRKHPRCYIKPANGTGGRGILLIRRSHQHLECIGSDADRKPHRWQESKDTDPCRLIERWTHARCNDRYRKNYILQAAVDNQLPDGTIYDFRVLVQKNGFGNWQVGGIGVRTGAAGQNSSNLHNGGSAMSLRQLRQLPRGIAERLANTALRIAEICDGTPSRQCEFGCDLALDTSGQIYVLELNPKPGRKLFTQIGDQTAAHLTHVLPLEYATFLNETRPQMKKRAFP